MFLTRHFRVFPSFAVVLTLCICVLVLRSKPISELIRPNQYRTSELHNHRTQAAEGQNNKTVSLILSSAEALPVSSREQEDHMVRVLKANGFTSGQVKRVMNNFKVAREKERDFLSSIQYDNRSVVNPHTFHFTSIVETELCDSNTEILIIIFSAPGNVNLRHAVRESFGKRNLSPKLNLKIVFGFGIPESKKEQEYMRMESVIHRDMIQEDYVESYHNLSIKSVSLFKWASIFCPSAQYIVKTDDDILVDVYSLASFLYNYRENPKNAQQKAILGNVFNGTMPVVRDPESTKFYISKAEYESDFFSTFCSGVGYILTSDLTRALYIESLHVKKFKIDDFYTTGLLPLKLNATYVDITPYTAFKEGEAETNLAKRGTRYIFIQEPNPMKRAFIWKDIIFNHCQRLHQ